MTRAPALRPRLPIALILLLGIVTAACGTSQAANPGPTPATFTGIAASLRTQNIFIENVVSGEAGCNDPTLMPEAISFDARGLDQTTPVRVHLYIFGNGSVYTRLRSEVDACAASYVKNPDDYTTVDVTPSVAAGVGPWAPQFKDHLRTALAQAVSPDSVGI